MGLFVERKAIAGSRELYRAYTVLGPNQREAFLHFYADIAARCKKRYAPGLERESCKQTRAGVALQEAAKLPYEKRKSGFFSQVGSIASRAFAALATGGATEVLRVTGQEGLAVGIQEQFAPGLPTRSNMALNIGGLVSGIGGVLSGAGGALGTFGKLATVAGAFVPAPSGGGGVPMIASTLPTSRGPVAGQQPQAIPVGAPTVIAGVATTAARQLMRAILPILLKITQYVGLSRTVTLRWSIRQIRNMSKYLPPAAVAATLGITVAELAQLIMANTMLPRRRMNVSNTKALRRAMRRVEGFHKLCQRADTLRSRGRRRKAPGCAGQGTFVRQG